MKKRDFFLACEWIRPLATPYLQGYRAVAARAGSTRGYYFLQPATIHQSKAKNVESARRRAGFFVGYLVDAAGFEFLSPSPPECLVYVFVHPTGSATHRTLVAEPGSLVRKTFDYIRLLTHRPPRFVFHASGQAAMARHQSMAEWPAENYEHFSRNFYIETLAWLVRSAIVKRLLAEPLLPAERKRNIGEGRETASPRNNHSKNTSSN